MVLSVIRNVQKSLKYRGGWKGLLDHMYTVGFVFSIFLERTMIEIKAFLWWYYQYGFCSRPFSFFTSFQDNLLTYCYSMLYYD